MKLCHRRVYEIGGICIELLHLHAIHPSQGGNDCFHLVFAIPLNTRVVEKWPAEARRPIIVIDKVRT